MRAWWDSPFVGLRRTYQDQSLPSKRIPRASLNWVESVHRCPLLLFSTASSRLVRLVDLPESVLLRLLRCRTDYGPWYGPVWTDQASSIVHLETPLKSRDVEAMFEQLRKLLRLLRWSAAALNHHPALLRHTIEAVYTDLVVEHPWCRSRAHLHSDAPRYRWRQSVYRHRRGSVA